MREVPPNGERLIATLLNALSSSWRQLVVIAVAIVTALIVVIVLIERRLAGSVDSSALTAYLPLATDVVLLTLAAIVIIAALAWLVAVLRQLYREK